MNQIYEPAEDSYLLQKHVKKYAKGRVLDLGTGSGIQALTIVDNIQVKEIVAVDINEEAVRELNKKIKEKEIKKITAIQSDLFENVYGKFNLIIFNPPYLPQDKGLKDEALYGGKHGWEISKRFFKEAASHLLQEGKVLFLFSSLTNKEKINQIIHESLLQFTQIDQQKLHFEELFVYLIEKTPLLRELEQKWIESISYFTRGKRGNIFTGFVNKHKSHLSKLKVAIKIKREDSKAISNITNEANWLKKLNKENIGPKLLFSGKNYLVYKFVEGKEILEWTKEHNKKEINQLLIKVLNQCFTLDKMKVNKEEMHRPLKHVLVKDNQPTLIDFERCNQTDKPKNVTQFVEFICRMKKGNIEELRTLAKEYKEHLDEESFNKIIKFLE